VSIFANPVFIYFLSFLFEKDDTGSFALKVIFLLFAMIAPVVISVLQVVNEDTRAVALTLRWFFYPFPAFALTFGYISIANRAIMAQFLPGTHKVVIPGSFAMNVAGPSLIFLCASVPFYWVLIAMIEQKVFDRLCWWKRRNRGRADLVRR